jgi:hypothetical protein
LWPEATVSVEVPTVEGNGGGRGGQAVEEAGGEVGVHRGAKEELGDAASRPDGGRRGSSLVGHPRMKKMWTAAAAASRSSRGW